MCGREASGRAEGQVFKSYKGNLAGHHNELNTSQLAKDEIQNAHLSNAKQCSVTALSGASGVAYQKCHPEQMLSSCTDFSISKDDMIYINTCEKIRSFLTMYIQ